jgi:hypothetical protein
VVHFPVLFFIRARWLPIVRWQPDAKHLLLGAGIVAGVLVYAYAISLLTEANTARVRAWVQAKFARRPAPPPHPEWV